MENKIDQDVELTLGEDYDDLLDEACLDRKANRLFDSLDTSLVEEESEEDRINREADEYIQRRWKRAYDCYSGCVRNKYGEFDESDFPIDEDLLTFTSSKCNYDYAQLKDNLVKSMNDLQEK